MDNTLASKINDYINLKMEVSFKKTGYNSNEISMTNESGSTKTTTIPDDHFYEQELIEILDYLFEKSK